MRNLKGHFQNKILRAIKMFISFAKDEKYDFTFSTMSQQEKIHRQAPQVAHHCSIAFLALTQIFTYMIDDNRSLSS